MIRYAAALLTILLFSAAPVNDALGEPLNISIPDTSRAQSYTIISQQDFSAGYGRIRKALCVSSEAETYIARAHTAIRAAIVFQQETGADYVQVAVTPISGAGCSEHYSAIAEYSPDGGGVTGDQDNHFWQVKASNILLDLEERLLLKAWQEAKPDFEIDGNVDMERIKQHLSRQLNLSIKQVEDFWLKGVEMGFNLRTYPIDVKK